MTQSLYSTEHSLENKLTGAQRGSGVDKKKTSRVEVVGSSPSDRMVLLGYQFF